MQNEFLSIIIPVYNTERYIKRCIKSVCEQTTTNFELILVNDGSTDNSIAVAELMLQKSNKITYRIIHQQNSGVSVARNNGIREAKGKYILFLDSDDYLEVNLVERLFNGNNSEDLVFWGYNRVDENGNVLDYFNKNLVKKFRNKEDVFDLITQKKIWLWIGCQAFKRENIINNNLEFPIGTKYGEDLYFIFKYLILAKSISFIPNTTSYYLSRPSAATKNYTLRQFDSPKILIHLVSELYNIEKGSIKYFNGFIIPNNFLNVFKNIGLYGEKTSLIRYIKADNCIKKYLISYRLKDATSIKSYIKLKLCLYVPWMMLFLFNLKFKNKSF